MRKKRLSYNARLLVIIGVVIVNMLPIVFIVSNSFMSVTEAAARYTAMVTPHSAFGVISGSMHYMDMTFLPTLITASGWRHILFGEPAHLRFMWNSIILVVPIVLGQLLIAPLAAYGFERAKARHKDKLFFAYIIIMLLPMQALLVPHFIAANFLGISDGYFAVILPAVVAPFGVFLIRQQMKGFDNGLIEAAKIDGASELTVFWRIVLPNIKPALFALAVLAFAEAWNIVDQAVIFIRNEFALPMSVYLSTDLTGNIGVVFALSTLFMIPALIVFIYGQDDLSEGIIYSGRKQ
ncbi:MAG: carbohydrate ABC transporter permease [Defluviitaleaceae bacterium]|nr:carbohydrate ABC transporter permease [Defluviitaleaceae bacterium]